MKIRTSIFCFLLIFACAGILLSRLDSQAVSDTKGVDGSKRKLTIIVDAGHGGNDPGKIGVNGAKEKDINLEIAKLLQKYLQQQDVTVVMTRESDSGLYSESSSNKKSEDMRNRVAMITDNNADLLVSIHQNSFTEQKYSGAQVFYYTGSAEGQRLAETVQKQLISGADPDNHREAKANSDYYLLKKSTVTAIICECGFLSNPEECEKLTTAEYQRKIAWNIYLGIMQYINANAEATAR